MMPCFLCSSCIEQHFGTLWREREMRVALGSVVKKTPTIDRISRKITERLKIKIENTRIYMETPKRKKNHGPLETNPL